MLFICPKCREQLNICEDGAARCKGGHCYDRSRYGYYNLLLGSGGAHGDNADMVKARREFLSGGYYEPLAERVAALSSMHLPTLGVLLDAGCGEGYYTRKIREKLCDRVDNGGTRVVAFDISKDAVKEAAKKKCADDYAVASAYHMPLGDGSVDVLVNTFSPLAIEETARVIKAGGVFIMAIPAEEHLFGLKAAIYDTPYKNTVSDTALPGFSLISSEELRYTVHLDRQAEIAALFMMTPYAYRTGSSGREKVLSLTELTFDAHFMIFTYRKEQP